MNFAARQGNFACGLARTPFPLSNHPAAFETALRMRDSIFSELKAEQADPHAIFERYKNLSPSETASAA